MYIYIFFTWEIFLGFIKKLKNNFSYLLTFDINDYIFHKYFKNIISQYSKTTEADRTNYAKMRMKWRTVFHVYF